MSTTGPPIGASQANNVGPAPPPLKPEITYDYADEHGGRTEAIDPQDRSTRLRIGCLNIAGRTTMSDTVVRLMRKH